MPDISSNGFIARTASQTAAARTHTAANNKITIANGDGVSGNPTYTINEANFVSTPTGLTEKTQPALFAERVATVTNHAALEAIVPTSGAPTFYCTGHTSAGDGGEGLWRWVAGNSDTANGGTILGSDAAGRWKRDIGFFVSPLWFDPNPGTTEFQAAHNFAAANDMIVAVLPHPSQSYYTLSSTLTMKTKMVGLGPRDVGTKVRLYSGISDGSPLIYIGPDVADMGDILENICIYGDTNADGVQLGDQGLTEACTRVNLKNVRIDGFAINLNIDRAWVISISDCSFRYGTDNVVCNVANSITFNSCQFSNQTQYGFHFLSSVSSETSALTLIGCSWEGPTGTALELSPQAGVHSGITIIGGWIEDPVTYINCNPDTDAKLSGLTIIGLRMQGGPSVFRNVYGLKISGCNMDLSYLDIQATCRNVEIDGDTYTTTTGKIGGASFEYDADSAPNFASVPQNVFPNPYFLGGIRAISTSDHTTSDSTTAAEDTSIRLDRATSLKLTAVDGTDPAYIRLTLDTAVAALLLGGPIMAGCWVYMPTAVTGTKHPYVSIECGASGYTTQWRPTASGNITRDKWVFWRTTIDASSIPPNASTPFLRVYMLINNSVVTPGDVAYFTGMYVGRPASVSALMAGAWVPHPQATIRQVGSVFEIVSASAPSGGLWGLGDRAIDPSPSAGGTVGSIVTTAGSPGTWKTFGAIEA